MIHLFIPSLSLKMLHDMKKQFAGLLHDIGFVHSSDPNESTANMNSGQQQMHHSCLYSLATGNLKLVKAVLCAGLYPNVAKIVPGKRYHNFLFVFILSLRFFFIEQSSYIHSWMEKWNSIPNLSTVTSLLSRTNFSSITLK